MAVKLAFTLVGRRRSLGMETIAGRRRLLQKRLRSKQELLY
jgi:hypothetical protein